VTGSDAKAWTAEGTARAISIRAPAKLNLGLRIVGQRPDGYHLLESLFVPLDLSDHLRLRLEPAPRTCVRLDLEGGPPGLERGEQNLAARAATEFLSAAQRTADLCVTLKKEIPVGAGLGGGSSDAGTVLRALAAAYPGTVSRVQLAALAAALGADVPYFLDPRPAQVGGAGERIEPIDAFPSLPVVVATPEPPLRTAEVFRAWDARQQERGVACPTALTPAEPGRSMPTLSTPWNADGRGRSEGSEISEEPGIGRNPIGWRGLLANDLEETAVDLQPGVARLRAEIERSGARAVGMSGSGPTVFGVYRDASEARAAAARIAWEPTDRVHVGNTTGSP
jgi:4-diphosphocytidyl-2-C-methyl-D-erythritol kinase